MYENVVLEAQDVILKKAVFDDWKDLLENVWSHEETARYMLWSPTYTEEDAKARMQRTLDYEQKQKYALIVYEKKSMKAIGFAGMIENEPGVYDETGLALGPSFVGKGYGKQVLMALVTEAFVNCNATKFLASNRSKNIASKRLQMSVGFVYNHSEDKIDERNGEPYTIECNVMTREVFEERYKIE